jgi:SAM-dependent methyltransferase
MMSGILGIDWRDAWVEHNRARKAPDGASYWDGRAEHFSRHAGTSSYAEAFISLLAPLPGQSILDVGCGGGTLALPLARAGHEVFAVDFSQGMLAALGQAAQRESLLSIRTALLDFNTPWEGWEAVGVTENGVDIAFASRSTMVDDLAEAFSKLERAARVKAAVTMATEFGPRGIKRMGQTEDDKSAGPKSDGLKSNDHQAAGNGDFVPDFVFAVNLLLQMGRYPELRFIDSYKSTEHGPPQLIRWAFISWRPC